MLSRLCFQWCPESLASLRASARIAFVKDSAGAVRCKFGQEALWVADSLLAKDIQNGLEATSPVWRLVSAKHAKLFLTKIDWSVDTGLFHRFFWVTLFHVIIQMCLKPNSKGSAILNTSRDGRDLHHQSFHQQPSCTPTRQKIRFARELLPKFLLLQCIPASFQHIKCQNGGSKQRLHANNGKFWAKDTQDGVIGFLGILNKLSEMVPLNMKNPILLNEPLPKFECKNA